MFTHKMFLQTNIRTMKYCDKIHSFFKKLIYVDALFSIQQTKNLIWSVLLTSESNFLIMPIKESAFSSTRKYVVWPMPPRIVKQGTFILSSTANRFLSKALYVLIGHFLCLNDLWFKRYIQKCNLSHDQYSSWRHSCGKSWDG